MRNYLFLLLVSLLLTSATPLSRSGFSQKPVTKTALTAVVLYGTISNTFYVNGCEVSITQGIAYVFDDQTFMLIAVYVSSNFYISINCGGHNPFDYEIRASDVQFTVDGGHITDVIFAKTGNQTVDNLLGNSSFRLQYRTYVEAEKPEP